MFDASIFFNASNFIGAGFAIGFGAIGAALGEGYTAGIASEALSQRPERSGDVVRNMLVGQAIAESAAIFALVVAIILLFARPDSVDQLARPGAVVSGKVTLSDGNTAAWQLNELGQLGIAPQQPGYRPPASDVQQFQMALEAELSKLGL